MHLRVVPSHSQYIFISYFKSNLAQVSPGFVYPWSQMHKKVPINPPLHPHMYICKPFYHSKCVTNIIYHRIMSYDIISKTIVLETCLELELPQITSCSRMNSLAQDSFPWLHSSWPTRWRLQKRVRPNPFISHTKRWGQSPNLVSVTQPRHLLQLENEVDTMGFKLKKQSDASLSY